MVERRFGLEKLSDRPVLWSLVRFALSREDSREDVVEGGRGATGRYWEEYALRERKRKSFILGGVELCA